MRRGAMKSLSCLIIPGLALFASAAFTSSALAQDDASEVIVTAQRIPSPGAGAVVEKPPVIGLKRQADSAVRNIEIMSDSRDAKMRRREVQAMLLAALDRAKREGLSLVTGQFEVVEITGDNWRDQFPALAGKVDADADDEDDDDEEEDSKPKPSFEDSGSNAIARLKVKVRLDGSISNAQQRITAFVKAVPPTGRSQIEQKGGLALTIVNPDQYRDEIYRRIAAGANRAVGFYGADYAVNVSGLDRAVAWSQVSNTDVFLYIPYSFSVGK